MSGQPTTTAPPAKRRASDALINHPSEEYSLDQFFHSMQQTRVDRPRWVELRVHPKQLGLEDKIIRLVVTNIRQIWIERELKPERLYYRYPDFEVEGWLDLPSGQSSDEIWVRCELRMDDLEGGEILVYRLEPGEEHGTSWARSAT